MENRLLIVEGMDNTGKTTLINRLGDDLKMVKINNRQRPRSREEMFAFLYGLGALLVKGFPVLLDRWAFISEPIYGPICRNTDLLGWSIDHQISFIRNTNPVIIYCRPPDAVILDFGDRPQMSGVISHSPELLRQYDWTMVELEKAGTTVIPYDWTSGGSYDNLLPLLQQTYQP